MIVDGKPKLKLKTININWDDKGINTLFIQVIFVTMVYGPIAAF
jgi:hypothetical protein